MCALLFTIFWCKKVSLSLFFFSFPCNSTSIWRLPFSPFFQRRIARQARNQNSHGVILLKSPYFRAGMDRLLAKCIQYLFLQIRIHGLEVKYLWIRRIRICIFIYKGTENCNISNCERSFIYKKKRQYLNSQSNKKCIGPDPDLEYWKILWNFEGLVAFYCHGYW